MRNRAPIPLFLVLFALGCMDPTHEYGECKKIEIARCQLRKNCQSLKNEEFDKRFDGFDYDTCVTYAKEHCRTREIGHPDATWNDEDVTTCVQAIAAIYPGHCGDLRKGEDETDAETGLISYPPDPDSGLVPDAGPDGPCWFINRLADEEKESEDSGSDDDSDSSEDKN